jgi:hypothetical protein
MANVTIYASDKTIGNSSGSKFGIIQGHYFRVLPIDNVTTDGSGNIVSFNMGQWFTISTTKTSGFSTFSVATHPSGSGDLVVTTDSNCRIVWRADCAI